MTVGISMHNGLEAIVVADAKVSMGFRESDRWQKVGAFEHETFHGVLYGAGNGEFLSRVLENLPEPGSGQKFFIESYVKQIESMLHDYRKDAVEQVAKDASERIMLRAEAIPIIETRQKYIETETSKALKEAEDCMNTVQTGIIVVAYDKSKSKIRQFQVSASGAHESTDSNLPIGSGSDASQLYFAKKLQGLDTNKLGLSDLMFFGANAYSDAQLNHGVGGTPSIVRINEEGVSLLGRDKVCAIVNLSAAYMTEYDHTLTLNRTRQLVASVMSGSPDYVTIAKKLDLNVEALTTTAIPYSAWQARANARHFNGNH
ncbi:hypothetical protein JW968_03570 [Candidatus Woesearchaeota archaeon]|nr:hypothetical protein [Candidatus Woesearchaeota archaeon]